MAYQIIDRRTGAQVSFGLSLSDAARACQGNRHYIFIPAR